MGVMDAWTGVGVMEMGRSGWLMDFFLKYSWKKCLMNWINIVTEKEEPNMTLGSLHSNQKTMTIAVEMDKVSVGADLQKN